MTNAMRVAAMTAALSIAAPALFATLPVLGAPEAIAASEDAKTKVGDLVLASGWMRQPPPGAKVGGGYVVITNTGAEDDRLVAADAPFAGHVEIHEMKMEGGVMLMAPLEAGLVIPAGETVRLEPGGFHIMFMALKDAPQEGRTVPVTLRFERAGEVTLEIAVAEMGASAAPHGAHSH